MGKKKKRSGPEKPKKPEKPAEKPKKPTEMNDVERALGFKLSPVHSDDRGKMSCDRHRREVCDECRVNFIRVNQMIPAQRCARCGQHGSLQCSRCHGVIYCSVACQRFDWATHKGSCRKGESFSLARAPVVENIAPDDPRWTKPTASDVHLARSFLDKGYTPEAIRESNPALASWMLGLDIQDSL